MNDREAELIRKELTRIRQSIDRMAALFKEWSHVNIEGDRQLTFSSYIMSNTSNNSKKEVSGGD